MSSLVKEKLEWPGWCSQGGQWLPDALDTVLGHPYLRAWVVRRLDGLGFAQGGPRRRAAGSRRSRPPWGNRGGGRDQGGVLVALTVPVVDGAVHLPGIGRLVFRSARAAKGEAGDGRRPDASTGRSRRPGDCTAEPAGRRILPGGALPRPAALPRWPGGPSYLGAGPGADGAGHPGRASKTRPVPRLPPAARRAPAVRRGVRPWQRHFELAWQEIQAHHAAFAPALAAGLAVLTPMAPPGRIRGQRGRPASIRRDWKRAARRAGDPGAAADQEFQHVKLAAVLDLFDLYDRAGRTALSSAIAGRACTD